MLSWVDVKVDKPALQVDFSTWRSMQFKLEVASNRGKKGVRITSCLVPDGWAVLAASPEIYCDLPTQMKACFLADLALLRAHHSSLCCCARLL